MKTSFVPKPSKYTIAVLLLLGTGCQKIYDYVHLPQNGGTSFSSCRIQTMDAIWSQDTLHYQFNYNQLGDPVSIINSQPGTGNPNYFFTYDRQNRLRENIGRYANDGYEVWHRYGYNALNQIVTDTSFTFGMVGSDGKPKEQGAVLHAFATYRYDAQNRISEVKDSMFTYGSFVGTDLNSYTYDVNGNLNSAYSGAYDNKLNILRTHKVWMFIARNYSVNNRFTAESYNDQGLPLRFYDKTYSLSRLVAAVGQLNTATYACK